MINENETKSGIVFHLPSRFKARYQTIMTFIVTVGCQFTYKSYVFQFPTSVQQQKMMNQAWIIILKFIFVIQTIYHSNYVRYRYKIEIIALVLESANVLYGVCKTRLMYKTSSNPPMLEKYLSILIENDLIAIGKMITLVQQQKTGTFSKHIRSD